MPHSSTDSSDAFASCACQSNVKPKVRTLSTSPCPVTGMNLRLFDNVPDSHRQFTKVAHVDREDLTSNKEFTDDLAFIIPNDLDEILHCLYKPEYLHFKIRNLVVSHLERAGDRSIGLKYFIPFTEKFPQFVMKELMLPEDAEEVILWGRFLKCFIHIMVEEEEMKRFNQQAMGKLTRRNECCHIL